MRSGLASRLAPRAPPSQRGLGTPPPCRVRRGRQTIQRSCAISFSGTSLDIGHLFVSRVPPSMVPVGRRAREHLPGFPRDPSTTGGAKAGRLFGTLAPAVDFVVQSAGGLLPAARFRVACHTPRLSPCSLTHRLRRLFRQGKVESSTRYCPQPACSTSHLSLALQTVALTSSGPPPPVKANPSRELAL